ncbi:MULTISPECIES: GNAT family N-acetyltransferase [Aerosakkonema]|uniref:GNAT family N-acetyltransferase n=1 Tax=Aerosakkonema TaxID=1246629 RepID=UPI0035B7848D
MKPKSQIKIQEIDDKSPHLQTVISLGDANRSTLGFFPEGAFIQQAKQRHILVAIGPQTGCIGYLLYRQSYDRITIVHLCVDPAYRGKGVARELVKYLQKITQEYRGIGLTCRRDYEISKMWPKLGFVYQFDKPARERGKQLTYWWLEDKHLPLIYTANQQILESKLGAIIDNNVFFYMVDDEDKHSQESKALIADWLQSEVALYISNEIFNQINNISHNDERERKRQFAKEFNCLATINNDNLNSALQKLENFLHKNSLVLDEYGHRHLARTLASEIQFFITLNPDLIRLCDKIYKEFRISIVTPTELIIQLESISKKPDYQPVRLAGTSLQQNPVIKGKENIINDYFQASDKGETKAQFQQKLRRFIAEPDKFECLFVVEGEKHPLALIVYDRLNKYELEIPMIRVANNSLAATLAHHLIFQATSLSAKEQRQFTRITDPYLGENITTAIAEDAFVRVENGFLRANLAFSETASQLSSRIINLANQMGQEYNFLLKIAEILNNEDSINDIQTMAQIERNLWPVKIIDADIPTFIIPIEPRWAKDLFDYKLALQWLFGAKTELALNREAVYYCSGPLKGLKAPGRILWYVSAGDKRYCDVKKIRACSRLDEIVIGNPEDLFRQFRKFGVYEKEDLLKLIKNEVNNDIIALRFSDTEVFSNPITLKDVQKVLGNKTTMRSRFKITKYSFITLYTMGM